MPTDNVKFGLAEYNPVSGVQEDFSSLLKQFVDSGSVRYEQFAEIWRERSLMAMFYGRQNDAEVRELTEKSLEIAKSYLLPPNTFQIQIGGIYLLYALYYKQLFEPRAKIRLTCTEWQHIQSLMEEVRAQKHYDVEYIYCMLRHHNAFHYAAYPTIESGEVFTPAGEGYRQEGRSGEVSSELAPLHQDHTSIAELMEGDAIDQLSAIHDQYHRVKCAMAGPTAKEPQVSLNMIDSNLVQYITKKITTFEFWKKNRAGKRPGRKRHDSGPTTSESEADSESEKSGGSPKKRGGMGRRRAEIKARAMAVTSAVSKSRRHRKIMSLVDLERSPGTPSHGTITSEDDINASKSGSLDTSSFTSPLADKSGLSMPTFKTLLDEAEDKAEKPKRKSKKDRKAPGKKVKTEKEPKPKKKRRKDNNSSASAEVFAEYTPSSGKKNKPAKGKMVVVIKSPKKKKVPTATLR